MEKFATLPDDTMEQILVRSNAEDLIRYKSMCKSWQSFISNSRFVKLNLNHSYNNNHNKNIVGYRSILYDLLQQVGGCFILGSSNGLVCVSTIYVDILVANPSTREVRKLPKPTIHDILSLYGGFGYDPLTDDYKVIIVDNRHKTRNQVLSLKSNVWKVIEQVKYTLISKVGILCNGALHWFMNDENMNEVIVSFDLSLEEFKEIPQPNDLCYQWRPYYQLGIMKECLSMYDCGLLPGNMWIMNKYNVWESWGMLKQECKINREISLSLSELKNSERSLKTGISIRINIFLYLYLYRALYLPIFKASSLI